MKLASIAEVQPRIDTKYQMLNVKIMRIIIKRYRKRPETIDGHLYIFGAKICDTAENATRALPEGEYQIHIHYCKQYKRKVLRLKPLSSSCEACEQLNWVFYDTTLPCYCPQLKIGNGVYNRPDGSIIVGKYLVPGCLLHSKDAYDPLYQRIRKSIERGNEVFVTIKNEFV